MDEAIKDIIDGAKVENSGIDKDVLEVYRKLSRFMDADERRVWKEHREKNWRAIGENEMWTDAEKAEIDKAKQIPLVVNKIAKGVQGAAAIVTDQKPEVKFHPIGKGDRYVADLLQRAHDQVWIKNNGGGMTYRNVRESKIGGLAFFNAFFDPSQGLLGRVINQGTDPLNIYFDAKSREPDYSDTDIIKAVKRTKTYILDHYDGLTEDDLYYRSDADTDEAGKSSGVTGEDNYAIADSVGDTKTDSAEEARNVWEIEAWLLKTVKELWVVSIEAKTGKVSLLETFDAKKKDEAEAFAKSKSAAVWSRRVTKREQRIIVGKKMVSSKMNPYGTDADGNPVIGLIGLPHDTTLNAYPICPTTYALPINREKNKARMQYTHGLSQLLNAPLGWPAGKVKWTGNPGTPGSHFEYDYTVQGQAVYRVSPGGVDLNKCIEREQLCDRDIDEQYDMSDVMRGNIPKGQENIAGRTVLALQDMAGSMSRPYIRQLEDAMVRLAKVNTALILKHWTRDQWERLLEDEEKIGWAPEGTDEAKRLEQLGEGEDDLQLKQNIAMRWQQALELIRPADIEKEPGISLIDVDVKITAGSSMQTNRIAKSAEALERVKLGVYDPQAYLEYIDDPKAEEIANRIKQREEKMVEAGIQQKMKKGA